MSLPIKSKKSTESNPFLRFCKTTQNELFRLERGSKKRDGLDRDEYPDSLETSAPLQAGSRLTPERSGLDGLATPDKTAPFRNQLRRDDDMARLEAVLFLAREPLSSRKLAQFADLEDGSQVRRLLRELNQRYDEQPCAFRIVEVGGGYQLRTRAQFAPWLVRLQEVPIEVRLSSTTMETLAIVAYKQPVLRAEIESIRGVQCGEVLRQLSEKNLIKIVGRSEELGRPFLYGTTPYFLQVFGLNSLNDLRQCDSPPS